MGIPKLAVSKFRSLLWLILFSALACPILVGCEKEEKAVKQKKATENPLLEDEQARGAKPKSPAELVANGEATEKAPEKPLQFKGVQRRYDAYVEIGTAAFSPDNKYLLVGFKSRRRPGESLDPAHWVLKLWEVSSGKELRTFPGHELGVWALAFMPEGKALSIGGDHYCRIWDLAKGELVRQFRNDQSGFYRLALSPNGKSALNQSGLRVPLELWDVEQGKLISTYQNHKNPITFIIFSPKGNKAILGCETYVFPGGEDHTSLQLWDTAKGRVELSFGLDDVAMMAPAAFSPDAKFAVSNQWEIKTKKGRPALWDVATGKDVRKLGDNDTLFAVALAVTKDGKHILAVDDERTLFRFQVASRQQVMTSRLGHGIPFICVFSPDASLVFLGSGQAKNIEFLRMEIFDAETGESRKLLKVNSTLERR